MYLVISSTSPLAAKQQQNDITNTISHNTESAYEMRLITISYANFLIMLIVKSLHKCIALAKYGHHISMAHHGLNV